MDPKKSNSKITAARKCVKKEDPSKVEKTQKREILTIRSPEPKNIKVDETIDLTDYGIISPKKCTKNKNLDLNKEILEINSPKPFTRFNILKRHNVIHFSLYSLGSLSSFRALIKTQVEAFFLKAIYEKKTIARIELLTNFTSEELLSQGMSCESSSHTNKKEEKIDEKFDVIQKKRGRPTKDKVLEKVLEENGKKKEQNNKELKKNQQEKSKEIKAEIPEKETTKPNKKPIFLITKTPRQKETKPIRSESKNSIKIKENSPVRTLIEEEEFIYVTAKKDSNKLKRTLQGTNNQDCPVVNLFSPLKENDKTSFENDFPTQVVKSPESKIVLAKDAATNSISKPEELEKIISEQSNKKGKKKKRGLDEFIITNQDYFSVRTRSQAKKK